MKDSAERQQKGSGKAPLKAVRKQQKKILTAAEMQQKGSGKAVRKGSRKAAARQWQGSAKGSGKAVQKGSKKAVLKAVARQ